MHSNFYTKKYTGKKKTDKQNYHRSGDELEVRIKNKTIKRKPKQKA